MRLKECGLIILLVLAVGCQPSRNEGQPETKGMARCGGTDPVAGFKNIVAGMDNEFYTARTRQSLKIKPDAEVKTKVDEKGTVVGLTIIARDNSVNINCACPGGCKSDPGPGHGCVIDFVPGGGEATCSGDCVTSDGCCFGCGWQAPF